MAAGALLTSFKKIACSAIFKHGDDDSRNTPGALIPMDLKAALIKPPPPEHVYKCP